MAPNPTAPTQEEWKAINKSYRTLNPEKWRTSRGP